LLERAAGQQARLAVLTEMFATGFSLNPERVVEPLDGPTTAFLAEQARRTGMWIGGSIPTDYGSHKPRNTFTLVSPDAVIHRYDKLHPFSYSGEDTHYDAGSSQLTVSIDGVRITPLVCYDLRFANAFWQLAPATDLYVVAANWPEARRDHWMALLRARAIENQAYVLGVNRVGNGGGLHYSGDSRIIDPWGAELVTAQHTEAVLVADVDPARVAEVRSTYPFLNDRRAL
jgi:predicted amidohydrolase